MRPRPWRSSVSNSARPSSGERRMLFRTFSQMARRRRSPSKGGAAPATHTHSSSEGGRPGSRSDSKWRPRWLSTIPAPRRRRPLDGADGEAGDEGVEGEIVEDGHRHGGAPDAGGPRADGGGGG